ncbi:MAG: hypothetical protein K6G80_09580 [Treponema sp.]|nr:hypothetical protein [Treponema sp.]
MKKLLVLAASAALLLASCASTDVKSSKFKADDPKVNTGKTELMEWQGSELGGAVPQWVIELANGNFGEKALARVMPDIEGKKTFVTIGYGDNLEFVRQWTDLVDVETEVASTLSRVAAKAVEASMNGAAAKEGAKQANATKVEQSMNMYRTSLSSVRFSGLEKTAQFWTLSHKVKGKEEVEAPKYAYYAVWTIDQKLFDQQLAAAMKNVNETSTEEKALKDMVRQKLASQLSVASNDTSTTATADDFVVFAE